ncbi:MAG: VCBS repeat-containing protein, partial [Pseudomonadales bacterium]|nr:VCBS repeat-containing protein [Pseudomonadales bacterium]
MMKRFVIVLLLLGFIGARASAAEINYAQLPFTLPADTEQLIVADTNGDGLNDFITVTKQALRIYFQDEQGFEFAQNYAEIQFNSDAIGWDLSQGYGDADSTSIIALVDGSTAQVWHVDGNQLQPPEVIQTGLPGFISKGVNRLHFSRDINEDGLEDLVIPGAGVINILINAGDGNYQSPLSITSDMRLRTQLNINRFNRSAGQAVRIPVIELRDVSGDGADDLVSRTEERLDVFIAQPQADPYLPQTPSYSLDIAEIEERLGEFDIDNLDFSNLTGVLALTHEEILEDVDNDNVDDLLLREGGKVSLFKGSASGMDLETPQQVLRSGGNVLSTFLYDENEDGLKDLWLWRVEPISVGDIFVWLALSGSIAIEAFVYPNDGERFARRPTRKVAVDLKFPSVIRLASAYEDLSSEVESLEAATPTPTATANLNDNLDSAELLALVNNQVEIFLDSIQPEPEETEFLGALGYSRQRDNYEINVREIIENV